MSIANEANFQYSDNFDVAMSLEQHQYSFTLDGKPTFAWRLKGVQFKKDEISCWDESIKFFPAIIRHQVLIYSLTQNWKGKVLY